MKKVKKPFVGINFVNKIIGDADPNQKFTANDYIIIDLLNKSHQSSGDVIRKLKMGDCCWEVEITIATVPSNHYNHDDVCSGAKITEVNCDITNLIYLHEGVTNFAGLIPIIAKIYLTYIDAGTHILMAKAFVSPMSLKDRIKTYGPFKTNVNHTDDLLINYEYDPIMDLNYDLLDIKTTNHQSLNLG